MNKFWIAWFALVAVFVYFEFQQPDPFYLNIKPAHMQPLTFNERVGVWARDLHSTPNPAGSNGNCLPVAVKLQSRIVDTGRMAVILAVDPTPDDDILHAIVFYDSDKDGSFDSLIDNGYTTNFVVQPESKLRDGSLGKYVGKCEDVDPRKGQCRIGMKI